MIIIHSGTYVYRKDTRVSSLFVQKWCFSCLELDFSKYFFAGAGCLILLATPKFPYVPESRKKESRTGHSQKMAESRTCHPLTHQSWGLCHFLGVASPGLCHFFGVASSGLCFFFWILAHRQIWGWQEGSDTLYIFFGANFQNLFWT